MSAKSKKILKWVVGAVVIFVCGAGVYLSNLLRDDISVLQKTQIKISGLTSPVKVERDEWGIPHIFAQNERDAVKTLGYIMASERLFQMEIYRRLAAGELSEILGDKTLNIDKMFRTYQFKKAIVKEFERKKRIGTLNPELMAQLQSFCDGVNAFIAEGVLSREFKVLRFQPKKFEPYDLIGFAGYMSWSFATSYKLDLALSKFRETMPKELVEDLRNEIDSDLARGLAPFDGSNAWLVSKTHSQSGASLFANDPHISYSSPGIWFEAHIKTPNFEVYGHFLPILPFPVLGWTPHHAWGLTMSEFDDMDFYQEKIGGDNFEFRGEQKPLKISQEVIKVKHQPDVVLPIRETVHGPLLDEVIAQKGVALRWSYLDEGNDPIEVFYDFSHTATLENFKNSLSKAKAPGLNIMYADRENIAWWVFGDVVLRPPTTQADFILDGASGENEWIRSLSTDEKPHEVNPTRGYIVTANSRPPGLAKNIRGLFQPSDRYETLMHELGRLTKNKKLSAQDMMNLQTRNFNEVNAQIRNVYKESVVGVSDPFELRALFMVMSWNLESDVNSVGATIFYRWQQEIMHALVAEFDSSAMRDYLSTQHWYSFYKRLILNPQSEWWKKKSRQEVIRLAFSKTVESLKKELGGDMATWRWGRVHTIEFVHPLGRAKPLDRLFNEGPFEIPGAFNEINNNKWLSIENFNVLAGPSTRRVIDLAQDDSSYGIIPMGQSGHPKSKHYLDQLKMFLDGKYRLQIRDEKLLQQHLDSENARVDFLPAQVEHSEQAEQSSK